MNEDAFEKKLESLAGAVPRPDPTPQWKADILARARREAATVTASPSNTTTPRRVLPPRWLMTVWCTAWAVIAFLHFSKPSDTGTTASWSVAQLVEAKRTPETGPQTQHAGASPLTLLALNRELSTGTITTFDIP
jgi:hypothetical protein